MKYVEFSTDMKLETLMNCHMNAFPYFKWAAGTDSLLQYENSRIVL